MVPGTCARSVTDVAVPLIRGWYGPCHWPLLKCHSRQQEPSVHEASAQMPSRPSGTIWIRASSEKSGTGLNTRVFQATPFQCATTAFPVLLWFPAIPPIIPYAIVSLVFVLGFRLTCYYYRRAYYRAFWRAPAACAVREPHAKYTGETRFPLIMQNLHRYFFYMVILISILNTYDAVQAFHGKDGGVGFGLGTLIIVVNVVLLWAYTLSCHSCLDIQQGAGARTSPSTRRGTGPGPRSPK